MNQKTQKTLKILTLDQTSIKKKNYKNSLQPTVIIRKSTKNTKKYNYKIIIYKGLNRNKMADKFKKITAVTKAAATIKIPTNIYNNCPTMYEQTITSKDKFKWLAVIQDKLNL